MTRDAVLARAKRHFDRAEELLDGVEYSVKQPDRSEIVRQRDREAVALAAAHAALGQGLVALAGVDEPETVPVPDEPMGQLCMHARGVIRRYAPEGAMGSSWLHATDMSRCDSPPTG